ncbi:MAG: dCTP deaminase, partial [Clostridium sp.]|nr:dCTP deaminase [Clostridium sp.]
MILSGQEIYKCIGSSIIIEPFKPSQLNPNSYNLALHNELMVYDDPLLDMSKPNKAHTITIPETGLLLQSGTLYLGRTAEYTRTDGFVPMLEGRSSVGRLGMC